MSSIATAVVAAAVIGGVSANRAAKKAANAQMGAAQMGVDAQNAQFERVRELLAPYIGASTGSGDFTPVLSRDMIDASGGDFRPNEDLYKNSPEYRNAWDKFIEGHQAMYGVAPSIGAGSNLSAAQRQLKDYGFNLDDYNAQQQLKYQPVRGSLNEQQAMLGLSGPDAERAAIGRIEQSQGFQSAVQQGENALLQNASATGGLRGGNIQAALAQFRPRMLAAAIEDQYSKLAGITSLGQNAAAGVGNAGMQTGANTANLLGQMGAAQAGGYIAQGQNTANFASAVPQAIGAYQGYNRPFGGSTAPQLNTAQQYGTVPGSQQTNMLQAQEAGF